MKTARTFSLPANAIVVACVYCSPDSSFYNTVVILPPEGPDPIGRVREIAAAIDSDRFGATWDVVKAAIRDAIPGVEFRQFSGHVGCYGMTHDQKPVEIELARTWAEERDRLILPVAGDKKV